MPINVEPSVDAFNWMFGRIGRDRQHRETAAAEHRQSALHEVGDTDRVRIGATEPEVAMPEAAGRGVDPGNVAIKPEVVRESVADRTAEGEFSVTRHGGHTRFERDAEARLLRV